MIVNITPFPRAAIEHLLARSPITMALIQKFGAAVAAIFGASEAQCFEGALLQSEQSKNNGKK